MNNNKKKITISVPIEDHHQIVPIEDHHQIVPIEDHHQIVPIEDHHQIVPIEDHHQIVPVEDHHQIVPVEDHHQIVPVEDHHQIVLVEDHHQIVPVEDHHQIVPIEDHHHMLSVQYSMNIAAVFIAYFGIKETQFHPDSGAATSQKISLMYFTSHLFAVTSLPSSCCDFTKNLLDVLQQTISLLYLNKPFPCCTSQTITLW